MSTTTQRWCLKVLPLMLGRISLLALAVTAKAFATFRIEELYTNEDGSIQYVRLREQVGLNNPCVLAGLQLISVQGAPPESSLFRAICRARSPPKGTC